MSNDVSTGREIVQTNSAPAGYPNCGFPLLQPYGLRGPNTIRLAPFVDGMMREREAILADPSKRSINEAPRDVPVHAKSLAQGLLENYSVTSLDLHRCGITADGAYALAQVISSTRFLQELTLSRNRFGTKGSLPMVEALKGNQTVRYLNLGWNDLRDEFAIALAEALTMNNSIQALQLDRNYIGEDGAGALAASLSANTKLKYLSLSHNRLNAAGCGMVAEGILRSRTLLTLDLSMNGIATEGIFSLATALASDKCLSRLETLNLAYNQIGQSVVVLGQYLRKTKYLKELNVEFSYLEGDTPEWSSFTADLAENTSLIHLSVARNNLMDIGVKSLCNALTKSSGSQAPHLRYLDLTDVRCSKASILPLAAVAHSSTGHRTLSTLHLNENVLTGAEEDVAALLVGGQDSFGAPSTLTFVGLQFCHLTEFDVMAKAAAALVKGDEGKRTTSHTIREEREKALAQRYGPTGLSLRGNRAGDSQVAALVRLLTLFKGLQYADVAVNDFTAVRKTEEDEQRLSASNVRPDGTENNKEEESASSIPSSPWLERLAQWDSVFEANPKLKYIVLADDTVIVRADVTSTFAAFSADVRSKLWDGEYGSRPVNADFVSAVLGPKGTGPVAPPICSAPLDFGERDAMTPTQGFAAYSITLGSSMKRQLEMVTPFPTHGLFLVAGKPVKHVGCYRAAIDGNFPSNRDPAKRLEALAVPEETVAFEQNIGGILLTEEQLRREFNRLDLNGNGFLEKAEFKKVYRTFDDLGAPPSERQLDWLLDKYSGADQRLSFEEFCVVYLKMAQY